MLIEPIVFKIKSVYALEKMNVYMNWQYLCFLKYKLKALIFHELKNVSSVARSLYVGAIFTVKLLLELKFLDLSPPPPPHRALIEEHVQNMHCEKSPGRIK